MLNKIAIKAHLNVFCMNDLKSNTKLLFVERTSNSIIRCLPLQYHNLGHVVNHNHVPVPLLVPARYAFQVTSVFTIIPKLGGH